MYEAVSLLFTCSSKPIQCRLAHRLVLRAPPLEHWPVCAALMEAEQIQLTRSRGFATAVMRQVCNGNRSTAVGLRMTGASRRGPPHKDSEKIQK